MFNIVENLIGYTGQSNNYSSIMNICGALIIVCFVFLTSFVFEFLSSIFHK